MDNRKYKKLLRKVPEILIESPSEEDFVYADESDDDVEIPKREPIGMEGRKTSLRRNSISLPNLEEFEVLEQVNEDNESSENDTTEDEEIPSFRPSRNARRKSVTDPRMLKPPGDDEFGGTNSPANSITSVNSLASLLREKMQMLPATFKKKKSADYKIKIFVALLFIAIICMVSIAYALYYQKILQKAYFDRIKFNKAKRVIKIYNHDGLELVHGRLGVDLNYEKVHPCLPGDLKRLDKSICLEWMGHARLYLSYFELFGSVKCYNFFWIGLGGGKVAPGDCYDLGGTDSHWYGGGPSWISAWPLEGANQSFAPFVTGHFEEKKHNWGNVLTRYFINSKGAAVIIDEDTPLYVSVSTSNPREICFKATYDDFAYVNKLTPTPQLNYSICTSANMFDLHSFLTDDSLWDGLKKEDVDNINFLLSEPVWEITSSSQADFTEEKVDNYTGKVVTVLGFLKPGHILVNEFWQKQVGDFSVDTERFEEALQIMHRRGFRIVLSVQPFISTESYNFAEAVKRKLLVSERFSDRRIPALTRYKSLQSAGVLDVTNNKTIPWLVEKLNQVKEKFDVDSFYLDLGVAYDMPRYYQFERPLRNPDQYKTIFINSLQNGVRLFGVNSAVKLPKAPTFVSLPQFESSWEGLRKVIPTILTYGLVGYPFLIPGAVGGDFISSGSDFNVTDDFEEEVVPSKELYTRWLQLATFLPVIKYSHLPTIYDEKTLELAKNLTSLRQQKVTPLLKKYARISLDTGLPLIRPLWMLDSLDPACHVVADEFLIGEDLLVAPVLYLGATQREVYLPGGVWKDGIYGGFRKGSRWIHDYRVQDNQIAYFEKMPDNTRL